MNKYPEVQFVSICKKTIVSVLTYFSERLQCKHAAKATQKWFKDNERGVLE